ncbi:hemolysin family protein [Nocardia sp. NPDC050413]|uniref:hemolysin family protein n=1 Tax=Nocardia sp. NPDC050413 TaxID=3155784 RepID=UPI0033CD1715
MTLDSVVNIALVVVFILIGGVFAGTEMALVTLRESQIRQLAERGERGKRTAALAKNPNRFLSAVQIGVTVAGFFSAAYGASTLAPDFTPTLESWGLPDGVASATALIGTTLAIAYLSLVLGELVPKRLALQRGMGMSLATAPSLDRFAAVMRPVIWLLSVSTDALVRMLGGDPKIKGQEITHEELRDLLVGHSTVPEEERVILTEVFDAGHRSLAAVMRPRTGVEFLSAATPISQAKDHALRSGHTRYPVTAGSLDEVAGFVHLRDLLLADPVTTEAVADVSRPVMQFPACKPALATLAEMRHENQQIAIVVDEYGGTAGIVTIEDLVEEVVGEISDEFDRPPSERPSRRSIHQQIDGLLVPGDFAAATGVRLPKGPYETVAGFVLDKLQRMPQLGDAVVIDGHRPTVNALDGRRIAQLRVTTPTRRKQHEDNRR